MYELIKAWWRILYWCVAVVDSSAAKGSGAGVAAASTASLETSEVTDECGPRPGYSAGGVSALDALVRASQPSSIAHMLRASLHAPKSKGASVHALCIALPPQDIDWKSRKTPADMLRLRSRAVPGIEGEKDRKSTRLNSSHSGESRMPSSA